MRAKYLAVMGALTLAAGACGGPVYDACDPAYDPYGCYDPWGYCDAYGCYGLAARARPVATDASPAAAAGRALSTAIGAAREVRRLAEPGAASAGVVGPVELQGDAASGLPGATYRLVLDASGGAVRWRLETKPTGTQDDRWRAVFTGVTQPGGSGHDAQGVFGIDLEAWPSAVAGAAGGGRVLGSFADHGENQLTAYRLLSFRPGGAAAPLPDAVLSGARVAPDAGTSSSAAGARAAALGAPSPPVPPLTMPGTGS